MTVETTHAISLSGLSQPVRSIEASQQSSRMARREDFLRLDSWQIAPRHHSRYTTTIKNNQVWKTLFGFRKDHALKAIKFGNDVAFLCDVHAAKGDNNKTLYNSFPRFFFLLRFCFINFRFSLENSIFKRRQLSTIFPPATSAELSLLRRRSHCSNGLPPSWELHFRTKSRRLN